MTTDPTAQLFSRFSGQTGGGSYFVSNYPPFPYWTPAAVASPPEVLLRRPARETPLGVYVHVPFCRKRCHFCYFKVYTGKNAREVEDYCDRLAAEARLLAELPAVRGRRSQFLYIGGGTPSYLSDRQIRALRDGLGALVDFDGLAEFTFECEPGTVSGPKLEALLELGVTRLSLGVENLDDRVLALNGRAHEARHVRAVYQLARDLGVPQINIDLIAGMLGETDENWTRVVAETIALAPESVTIYPLELPLNTTIFKQLKATGATDAPVSDWPTKRRWMREAFEALAAGGYRATSAVTAARVDSDRVTFVYRDALWHGADMLGLGVSAFSHIQGTHYQNDKRIEDYSARIARGELAIQRGYVMNDEERLVRETVLTLKTGALDLARLRERYGVDVRQRFTTVIDALTAGGLAEVHEEVLQLTAEALLQVDRLLPVFFLPHHAPLDEELLTTEAPSA